jgi:hypothetical protein
MTRQIDPICTRQLRNFRQGHAAQIGGSACVSQAPQ